MLQKTEASGKMCRTNLEGGVACQGCLSGLVIIFKRDGMLKYLSSWCIHHGTYQVRLGRKKSAGFTVVDSCQVNVHFHHECADKALPASSRIGVVTPIGDRPDRSLNSSIKMHEGGKVTPGIQILDGGLCPNVGWAATNNQSTPSWRQPGMFRPGAICRVVNSSHVEVWTCKMKHVN